MVRRVLLFNVFFMLAFLSKGQSRWVKVREGLLFSTPPFRNCHASTIVEGQHGELSVACFGGSQEGKKDVVIFYGKINSEGKVIPREVADGVVNDSTRFPCWNPVLLKKKDGQLVLFYKVGPNPREWWGSYKTSDDNGATWSDAIRLPAGVLGPIKNKAIQLDNGDILCPSSVELANGRWRVFIERPDSQLRNWTVIAIDSGSTFDVIQPSILRYPKNRLQILCRSKQGNVMQAWSEDNGNTWSPLSKTSLLNPNSGTDAVTLRDGRQMIVYNPDVPGKDWFNGRAKLSVALSRDGSNWQDIIELENGTTEEYSYPAIIQSEDGSIHITYTYDRKNIKYVVLREVRSQ